jgi:ribosomal protein S18 acetylase RimI-like enzyme
MVDDDAPLRGVTIRQATIADIPDLVRLRRMMFEAMEWGDRAELDAMEAASATYFAEAIPGGTFYGWLAVTSAGEALSTGGVILDQHIPTPGNLSGKIGYVLNVVTVPQYRRRGIARRITQTALAWLVEQGIQRVELHTSDDGLPLYESLGFKPTTNEMRLEMGK